MTDIGEYFVGAYLNYFLGCDVVVYNVKDYSLTGKTAQNEIDVIGVSFENNTAYFCEVKTHIKGFKASGKTDREKLIESQFKAMQRYAVKNFPKTFKIEYMFWGPGKVQKKLKKAIGNCYSANNIIVDADYTRSLKQLIEYARENSTEFDNPFIRTLQIAAWCRAI